MERTPALTGAALDRRIWQLALPALGTLALEPAVSLLQTAAVGRSEGGTATLGALGVCEGLFSLALRLCNFLPYATAPLVAAAAAATEGGGGGAPGGARGALARQALTYALALGAALCVALQLGGGAALAALGARDVGGAAALARCTRYVRVRALLATN